MDLVLFKNSFPIFQKKEIVIKYCSSKLLFLNYHQLNIFSVTLKYTGCYLQNIFKRFHIEPIKKIEQCLFSLYLI